MTGKPEGNGTPPAEQAHGDQRRKEAKEPGAAASTGAVPADAAASAGALRPKSPREFIQERMRELDGKPR